MAKGKTTKGSKTQRTTDKTKAEVSKAQAQAKAAAATQPAGSSKSQAAPASSDIRRGYMKSLLGDYIGKHRGSPAIKPKPKKS